MPFWRIHSHTLTFSAEDQAAIAEAVVRLYKQIGLPAYYVHVLFLPLEEYYNGGKRMEDYVTVLIDHIARQMDPDDKVALRRMKDAVDAVMKPYTIDRGLHVEFTVGESSPQMWRIDGIDPPESFTADQTKEKEDAKRALDSKFPKELH